MARSIVDTGGRSTFRHQRHVSHRLEQSHRVTVPRTPPGRQQQRTFIDINPPSTVWHACVIWGRILLHSSALVSLRIRCEHSRKPKIRAGIWCNRPASICRWHRRWARQRWCNASTFTCPRVFTGATKRLCGVLSPLFALMPRRPAWARCSYFSRRLIITTAMAVPPRRCTSCMRPRPRAVISAVKVVPGPSPLHGAACAFTRLDPIHHLGLGLPKALWRRVVPGWPMTARAVPSGGPSGRCMPCSCRHCKVSWSFLRHHPRCTSVTSLRP